MPSPASLHVNIQIRQPITLDVDFEVHGFTALLGSSGEGKSTVLKPRVYSLTKTGCKPVPRRPDELECSVVAMVTFQEGDRTPGQHGERIYVRWDPVRGVWQAKK